MPQLLYIFFRYHCMQLHSEDSSSLFTAKIKFLSIEEGDVRINDKLKRERNWSLSF